MTAALQRSWRRAWRGLGARSDGDALHATLLAAYAEPQRRYHTRQHLGECLALFDRVATEAEHPAEVEAALWFHDAIYDIGRDDNEARSARSLHDAAREDGVAAEVAGRTAALVMATRHDTAPAGRDAQLLVDIDLAILGASAARFAEYEQQIRAEYAALPEATFRTRRRAVLAALLGRERLYATPRLHEALERKARAQLAATLRRLESADGLA
jgi:predicted metal-dependent HD superfamily phosphohydrolase